MNTHEFWMQRCLELARNGELTTAPNPMVGAVIVHGDGKDARILGEGYHIRPGEGHAEVNALKNVSLAHRSLCAAASASVSSVVSTPSRKSAAAVWKSSERVG